MSSEERSDERIVLGINAAYHESAAAILVGNRLIHAVEEERLTRIRHAKRALVSNPDQLPWRSIESCLKAVELSSLGDCDAIAYSLLPGQRSKTVGLDPYLIPCEVGFGSPDGEAEFDRRVRDIPRLLAERAGRPEVADRVRFVPHHRAHAASAFYCSPFDSAALLVVDGIGEQATCWLGRGSEEGLRCIEEIPYPHSIGLLWERVALYLGFTEYDACKVMGLAAYGDPDRFDREFERLFQIHDWNQPLPFEIDAKLARFRAGDVAGLVGLFGPARRHSESLDEGRFADVAAGLQKQTERALLTLCHRLAAATGERKLAYSGGTALNCVANARIERDGPFDEIYIIGAAHDAGTAIGAAAEAARTPIWNERRSHQGPIGPFLGPAWSDGQIGDALQSSGCHGRTCDDVVAEAASRLCQGSIVGWFQGRLEFGPRALGGRSLLADPRHIEVRDRLNQRVKHREYFRPFGAAVLAEHAADWFALPSDRLGASSSRDLMLLAYRVRSERASLIPAVVHRDRTCRIQTVDVNSNPLLYRLLVRFFELTGVPLLLNTSFNDQEPLVASPEDALNTMARSEIDDLFLQNIHVSRHGDKLASRGAVAEPKADQLFRPVRDAYGKRLALVFGNHADQGECPFVAASRCHHCDIGLGEGARFDLDTNRQRLKWYQRYFADDLPSVNHLVIYNSGSVLNPNEMPLELLVEILGFARSLPGVRAISVDSRESFVTTNRLVVLTRHLRQDQSLRVILGIESADDAIRNGLLQKGMSRAGILRAFSQVELAGEQLGDERLGVDVNILVGGPGTTVLSTAKDAADTARFALTSSTAPLDFNLHPYYPSLRGLAQFPSQKRCPWPTLVGAVEAVALVCRDDRRAPRLFIGVHDEGHDADSSGRTSMVRQIGDAINRFNATQELDELRASRNQLTSEFWMTSECHPV